MVSNSETCKKGNHRESDCVLQRLREYSNINEPITTNSSFQHNILQSESDVLWHSVPYNRRAAVLIVLYCDDRNEIAHNDDIWVVLTIRSSRLRTFPNQSAFPGGRCDGPNEGPWETALREAKEEIGFDPDNFEFEKLCKLPCFLSRNLLVVRPCVCFVQRRETNENRKMSLAEISPEINQEEVTATLSTKLKNFINPSTNDFCIMCAEETLWMDYRYIYYEFGLSRQDHWLFADGESPDDSEDMMVSGLTGQIALDCARVSFGYYHRSTLDTPVLDSLGFEPLIRQLLIDRVFHTKSKDNREHLTKNK